jgi:hypothetical protein
MLVCQQPAMIIVQCASMHDLRVAIGGLARPEATESVLGSDPAATSLTPRRLLHLRRFAMLDGESHDQKIGTRIAGDLGQPTAPAVI